MEIKADTAAKIAALHWTKAQGLSVDEYLRSLLPVEGDQPEGRTLSPTERARLWREWTDSVRGIVVADDSRDSIYTREDETL